ncbi:MAG: hypothetical protein ACRCUT_01895 [Spirochaetota bacterium]
MDMIRVWKEIDIRDIENHLVLLDDIQGFCPSCRKTGIKYDQLKKCPSCGIDFTWCAVRDAQMGNQVLAKIRTQAPWLSILDYGDFKHLQDKSKVKSLFKTADDKG